MPRPGFVLDVDRSTPPTLFWHGEGFRLEKLPVGARVVAKIPSEGAKLISLPDDGPGLPVLDPDDH